MLPPFPWTPLSATLEHIYPQGHGGTDATCVAVHSKCNSAKAGRKPTGCELLALIWVRIRVARSARLTALVNGALQTLGNVPSWARFGHAKVCDCEECQALDRKFPGHGQQLLLPVVPQRRR